MKIITWNCNMAFRKKAPAILAHQPDILVVPECEHPDILQFGTGITLPKDSIWFGANKNKGIGIFSYGPYRFKVMRNHNPELKMIIPIAVTGGKIDFTLFAIWANHPEDPDGQYVEQVWKAIHHYQRTLRTKPVILAGDFNSNTIWDRKNRTGNHSHVVEWLARKNIYSCYHLYHQQQQGKEAHPTLYLYRHQNKPYHLDYCFASASLAATIRSVEIGEYDQWIQYSDHVPVIVSFGDLK